MYRKHRVKIFPDDEQLARMENMITAEMSVHDLLLRNARDTWMEKEELPRVKDWFRFLEGIAGDNDLFAMADMESLKGTAVTLYIALKDSLEWGGPEDSREEVVERFPRYYEENDWDRMPVRIYAPSRLVFGDDTVSIPRIGDVRSFGGDRPGKNIRMVRLRWWHGGWWMEWSEFRKWIPRGYVYEMGKDPDGDWTTTVRRMRKIPREKKKGDSRKKESPVLHTGCWISRSDDE